MLSIDDAKMTRHPQVKDINLDNYIIIPKIKEIIKNELSCKMQICKVARRQWKKQSRFGDDFLNITLGH